VCGCGGYCLGMVSLTWTRTRAGLKLAFGRLVGQTRLVRRWDSHGIVPGKTGSCAVARAWGRRTGAP
jgi:hypothetical protein